MDVIKTPFEEVVLFKPRVYKDTRGTFREIFRSDVFSGLLEGMNFVQENESTSFYGVVRGLHYQLPPSAQAKLVRAVCGEIRDIVVDIREGSPTFGQHLVFHLTSYDPQWLFVPHGFAHGFSVLSKEATVQYKCDNYYDQSSERGILYSDPKLGIDWGIAEEGIILSGKDKCWPMLDDAEIFTYADRGK